MNTDSRIPFFAKISIIATGGVAFIGLLYVAQNLVIPLIFAILVAIVLSPVVNWLVHKGINRIVSIIITLLMVLLVSASGIALLSTQVGMFNESLPKLILQCHRLFLESELWVSEHFHISTFKINAWVDETNIEILSGSRLLIGQTLMNVGSVLIVMVLIPVYIFMILLYQPLLIGFIHQLFSSNKQGAVSEVLTATKKIIRSYLVGLMIEALIVSVLNAIALLSLGIEYAVLLAVLGALVNVIPYVGGVVAVALPMMIALATKPPVYALLVLAAYVVIQFIDNHYIIPKVVASKVQINALISIIVVLVGSELWGIPGMLLSIPLTAILKVVFDHVDGLKPWGFLLGNKMPGTNK